LATPKPQQKEASTENRKRLIRHAVKNIEKESRK